MDYLKAAFIAKYAYRDAANATGTLTINPVGSYEYKFFKRNNTECYALEDDTDVIIAIRGSSEIEDFIDGINMDSAKDPDIGRVHGGFYSCAMDIMAFVSNNIKGTEKNVYFIGHSMGGSVAKLLGLKFSDVPLTVYTFGEARSCKENVRVGAHQRYIRVINNCDIVPRIHFTMRFGVKNDSSMYLDRDGNMREDMSNLAMLKDVILTRIKSWLLGGEFNPIKDHSMISYIGKLM